jgi:hypothetical protein
VPLFYFSLTTLTIELSRSLLPCLNDLMFMFVISSSFDTGLDFVHRAFDILDTTGDGVVTVEDLSGVYDPSWHPDVKEGTQEPETVLRKLLDQFDTGAVKDGIITIEEFEEYYQNLTWFVVVVHFVVSHSHVI